jgi:hypothetical protein
MSMLKNNVIFRASLLVPVPVLAHNVKTSGNVAATFHIEPNHNPRAGEPAQTWFALTKQGGEILSLDRCNCQLKVMSGNQTIAQPELKAISAEKYKGIPGADVVFPKAGIYKLEISGTPKQEGDFSEFKLAYDVTVQAGQTSTASNPVPAAQLPSTNQLPSNTQNFLIPAIAVGLIASAGVYWFVKRTLKK